MGMALRGPAEFEARGLQLLEREHRYRHDAAPGSRKEARRIVIARGGILWRARRGSGHVHLIRWAVAHAERGALISNAFGLPHRGPSSISHPSPPQDDPLGGHRLMVSDTKPLIQSK